MPLPPSPRRPRRTLLLSLALLAALPLSLGWTESWESLQAAAGKLSTVEARFVQEKQLPMLAKPLISRGRLAFRRPGTIRWEYEAPLRSVTLARGDELARYTRRGEAWIPDATAQMEAMRVVMAEIGRWLAGDFRGSGVFAAELLPPSPGADGEDALPRVRLQPKDEAMGRFLQRIEVRLSPVPGVIHSVEIVEGERSRTVLRFEDVRVDAPLDGALFEAPR